MSPVKLKKRKFKEKSEESTLEIIKDPKTLEKKKKKKSGMDFKRKMKKEKLHENDEELPFKVVDTVDTTNFDKMKKKKKQKSKLGLKTKDYGKMHLDGIGHKEVDQKHQGVEKEKKHNSGLKKKRGREKGNDVDGNYGDHVQADEHVDSEVVHSVGSGNENLERKLKGTKKEKKIKLGLKKKRRREKTNGVDVSNECQIHTHDIEADDIPTSDHAKGSSHSPTLSMSRNSEKRKAKKLKGKMNNTQKDIEIANKSNSEEMLGGVEEKVEEIQSVDEDCSRGMKKWLIQYKESRPGLKILQERNDDFITAYEEQQEQERKEKEAQAAEGGWTVVVHHKGRKKTTEAETGVTVGSVAQAAVADKMGRKKSKEAPIDFYRFQRRQAHRNELMLLQSKFEQDKKRIQQLRAARKFRPY